MKGKAPHTKEVGFYYFDDLDDKGKECARQWWRECEAQDFGQSGEFIEEFDRLAGILGITFKTHAVRLMSGKDRQEPNVWWSLHSQGSGCTFEGTYSYNRGSVKTMKEYAPTDKVLHQIAKDLSGAQKKHGYALTATITHRGNYTYARSADIEVLDSRENGSGEQGQREAVAEAIYDFMEWMHGYIDDEYTYRMSKENVDDAIRANEYEFNEKGERI